MALVPYHEYATENSQYVRFEPHRTFFFSSIAWQLWMGEFILKSLLKHAEVFLLQKEKENRGLLPTCFI